MIYISLLLERAHLIDVLEEHIKYGIPKLGDESMHSGRLTRVSRTHKINYLSIKKRHETK